MSRFPVTYVILTQIKQADVPKIGQNEHHCRPLAHLKQQHSHWFHNRSATRPSSPPTLITPLPTANSLDSHANNASIGLEESSEGVKLPSPSAIQAAAFSLEYDENEAVLSMLASCMVGKSISFLFFYSLVFKRCCILMA